jgi:hypothetical protein
MAELHSSGGQQWWSTGKVVVVEVQIEHVD